MTNRRVITLIIVDVNPIISPTSRRILVVNRVARRARIIQRRRRRHIILVHQTCLPRGLTGIHLTGALELFPGVEFTFILKRDTSLRNQRRRNIQQQFIQTFYILR